jgi:hypothetical protein
METLHGIENQITILYNKFFKKNKIDLNTGIWNNSKIDRELRFATMPHIGDNYSSTQIKILFVGLDIGEDEYDRLQTFDERRNNVSMPNDEFFQKNPHMSGTYIETLCLLKDYYFNEWTHVHNMRDYQNRSVLLELKDILPINLLRNTAQTNYYKFVTKGRVNRRQGASDRDHFGISNEIKKLFLDEVEILNPDIIWFQGNDFKDYEVFKELKEKTCKRIINAYHPSSFIKKEFFGEVAKTNTPHYTELVVNNI